MLHLGRTRFERTGLAWLSRFADSSLTGGDNIEPGGDANFPGVFLRPPSARNRPAGSMTGSPCNDTLARSPPPWKLASHHDEQQRHHLGARGAPGLFRERVHLRSSQEAHIMGHGGCATRASEAHVREGECGWRGSYPPARGHLFEGRSRDHRWQLGFIDYNGKLNSKLNHGRIGEFEPREGPLDQPAAEQYDAAYRQARAEAGIQSRWSSRSRVAPGPVPVSLSSQSAICRIVAPLTRSPHEQVFPLWTEARQSLHEMPPDSMEQTRHKCGAGHHQIWIGWPKALRAASKRPSLWVG
jgi:hypothetical protein